MTFERLREVALAMKDIPLSDEEKKRLTREYFERNKNHFYSLERWEIEKQLRNFLLFYGTSPTPAASTEPPEEKLLVAAKTAQPDTVSSEKAETEHTPADSGEPPTVSEAVEPAAPAPVISEPLAAKPAQPNPKLREKTYPRTARRMRAPNITDIRRPLDFVASSVASRGDDALHDLADLGRARLLTKYCGERVNGGCIANARNWSRDEWLVRVHLREPITEDCPGLWHFENDDLIVDDYDAAREAEVLRTRHASKFGFALTAASLPNPRVAFKTWLLSRSASIAQRARTCKSYILHPTSYMIFPSPHSGIRSLAQVLVRGRAAAA